MVATIANSRVFLWITAVCCCNWAAPAVAAEIALRPSASPGATIVRLGDVADLRGAPEGSLERLADFPLMPAPAAGTKQFVTVRQIRDMLQAGGVSLVAHRFTGASQVAIGGETPEALRQRVGRVTPAQLLQVEDDLRAAIARHVTTLSKADKPWQVDLALDTLELRQLAEASLPWTIDGGREPWVGRQSVTVHYETPGGKGSMAIEAVVSLPEPVIVLTRPLARGVTITRADVALAPPSESLSPHRSEDPLHKLEDVIGKVVRRPLRVDQVLTPSMIEEPTLVRRGETVIVVALAHGIRITTEARAKQSGKDGELIYVETLDTREPFAAQVSGVREVQVIGR